MLSNSIDVLRTSPVFCCITTSGRPTTETIAYDAGENAVSIPTGKFDFDNARCMGSAIARNHASKSTNVTSHNAQSNNTYGAEPINCSRLAPQCPACNWAMEERSSSHFVCAPCRQSLQLFQVAQHQYLVRLWSPHFPHRPSPPTLSTNNIKLDTGARRRAKSEPAKTNAFSNTRTRA